jgi:hypothetical protein
VDLEYVSITKSFYDFLREQIEEHTQAVGTLTKRNRELSSKIVKQDKALHMREELIQRQTRVLEMAKQFYLANRGDGSSDHSIELNNAFVALDVWQEFAHDALNMGLESKTLRDLSLEHAIKSRKARRT